ncbi:hypothetical protein OIU84_013034 [Salix udensis]|uniref:Uncharacterized protein n=1 Tax=Salix udensis TaxID=889485 RepID=A0AAD6JH18_9ROSI|nr:hypothetical protein OIU84_013034 [Salix udensis]
MSEACSVEHEALIKPVLKVPQGQADLFMVVTAGLVAEIAEANFGQLASRHVKKACLVQLGKTVGKPPE